MRCFPSGQIYISIKEPPRGSTIRLMALRLRERLHLSTTLPTTTKALSIITSRPCSMRTDPVRLPSSITISRIRVSTLWSDINASRVSGSSNIKRYRTNDSRVQVPNTSNTQPKQLSLPADSRSTTLTAMTATSRVKYGIPIVSQVWSTTSIASSAMLLMPGDLRLVGCEEERRVRLKLQCTYQSLRRHSRRI